MFDRGVIHVVFIILSTINILFLTEELFMSLLYCLPLLFKIWQRSGSCCCCYIVYQYCLRFDRGVVHVVVFYIVYHWCLRFHRGVVHVVFAIFSTITGTDLGLTEEWFMSLLYCLPLLFKVWQRSGSCCCYIVYHCCLRFDRGVVHVVLYCLPLLFKVWQRSCSCSCYIVYHYCFRFDKGVVYVLVILSTITV